MFSGAVGRGRIDKVVLARRVGLRSPVELDVPNALRRLAASAPESTTYAFRRGGRTFLGATPERLVRTEGRTFRTVGRRRHDPPRRRRRRGRAARARAPGVREGPRGARDRRRLPSADLLPPVADTPHGRAGARRHDAALRPAPGDGDLRDHAGRRTGSWRSASASTRRRPSAASRATSRSRWSTSTRASTAAGTRARSAGWARTATASCASRCAAGSWTGRGATLFAGCGIVADSDPDAEWEESRIKLRAVISRPGHPGDER